MDTDLKAAEQKGEILGRDFLTWLWFKSELNSGIFQTREKEDFGLYLEKKIVVEGGEGESLEKAVCTGMMSELREARLGLKTGKKVVQAVLRFDQDSTEWMMQVNASDFSFSGVKTPKVETRLEEGDDPDAPFLEKMFLLEKVFGFLDDLFHAFLKIRFSDVWAEEIKNCRMWLNNEFQDIHG
ncbi:MAG: hypothetical protein ACOCV7_03115 [Desulfonatronovibrionaceae bacterium]